VAWGYGDSAADPGQSIDPSVGFVLAMAGDATNSTPKPLSVSAKEVTDQYLHACFEDKSKSEDIKARRDLQP
jgi:hypothetical protein